MSLLALQTRLAQVPMTHAPSARAATASPVRRLAPTRLPGITLTILRTPIAPALLQPSAKTGLTPSLTVPLVIPRAPIPNLVPPSAPSLPLVTDQDQTELELRFVLLVASVVLVRIVAHFVSLGNFPIPPVVRHAVSATERTPSLGLSRAKQDLLPSETVSAQKGHLICSRVRSTVA